MYHGMWQLIKAVQDTTSSRVLSPEPGRAEITIKAAILIQKWYRRSQERLKSRRQCAWSVFQALEYESEQAQLKLNNFFNELLHNISENSLKDKMDKITGRLRHAESEDKLVHSILHAVPHVEPGYNGPVLNFPLTQKQVHDLIKSFKKEKILHSHFLIQLLVKVRKSLKEFGNIRHASSSMSGKITVCGDIHGNLEDLLIIFYKNGPPSVKNPYVFNGDIVDRGKNSVEVCIILFCYFVMHPNELFINRGNHEDRIMNLRYGFVEEVMNKYRAPHIAKTLVDLFVMVFSWLPIATIIDQKILVLHGGVSSTTNFQVLSSIDRHRFPSILNPTFLTSSLKETPEVLKQRLQISDLLWSDPKDQKGCFPNIYRGGGCYFGPDVTKRILKENNFDLLIRSHECKMEGYEYTHDDLVLTLFSASNYYGPGTNRGAYLKLTGIYLDRQFVQFMSLRGHSKKAKNAAQRLNEIEANAVHVLWEKITSVKSQLLSEFQKYDPEDKGVISPCQWFAAMKTVTDLDLPWRSLLNRLAVSDEKGKVKYKTTFEMFKASSPEGKNQQVNDQITERVFRHKDHLETIFRMLDIDNSGHISVDEFEEAFTLLSTHINFSFKTGDVVEMAKSMDLNKDGYVDFNEFLHAFRIHATNVPVTPT